MPGRAVASIKISTIGDEILVVRIVINAHMQGLEMSAYYFLHVFPVQRTRIESQRANQVYLYYRR